MNVTVLGYADRYDLLDNFNAAPAGCLVFLRMDDGRCQLGKVSDDGVNCHAVGIFKTMGAAWRKALTQNAIQLGLRDDIKARKLNNHKEKS